MSQKKSKLRSSVSDSGSLAARLVIKRTHHEFAQCHCVSGSITRNEIIYSDRYKGKKVKKTLLVEEQENKKT